MGTLDTVDTVPCSGAITAHTPVINVHLASPSAAGWAAVSSHGGTRVTSAWATHLSCLHSGQGLVLYLLELEMKVLQRFEKVSIVHLIAARHL